MRIVTLLPAATEMVCALGLEDALVGRSHECDTPASILDRPIVTGAAIDDRSSSAEIDQMVREFTQTGRPLYHLDAKLLQELNPDLLVTQELCDVCAITPTQVDAALEGMETRPFVLRLGPGGLEDVLQDFIRLGQATDRLSQARDFRAHLEQRITSITNQATISPRPKVLFLEWLDPAFSAGHWNPELINRAGGENVLNTPPGVHSRGIDDVTLANVQPDLIYVAACGFTAERARREWDALPPDHPVRQTHRRSRARLVFSDGNAFFNRPGPRLVESLTLLAGAIRDTAASMTTFESTASPSENNSQKPNL
ncbi:MAG: ABC transporter substrate-binding protein [Planctomycetota bacterium]